MINSISYITINAAFLKEIKEDNFLLNELLESLSMLCYETGLIILDLRYLEKLIGELSDVLTMHFSLEDTYGYFYGPLKPIPVMCREARRLQSQHSELLLDLYSISRQIQSELKLYGNQIISEKLLQQTRKFQIKLMRHELGENELILTAYYEDLFVR